MEPPRRSAVYALIKGATALTLNNEVLFLWNFAEINFWIGEYKKQ
jgi:hypothetical protein